MKTLLAVDGSDNSYEASWPPTSYDQWLDPTVQQPDSLKALLRPYPSE